MTAGPLVAFAVLGWAIVGFLYRLNRRLERELGEFTAPFIDKSEDVAADKAASPQQYLYTCSKRLGVSTQTLKDLGFRAESMGDGWYYLSAAHCPEALENMAKAAVAEIAAEGRPMGSRIRLPATSWRWIALVAAKWARSSESSGAIIPRPGQS
ncbi:MAG: hypothetical protein VW405_02840 [Rhodospirillaceae bacterium]